MLLHVMNISCAVDMHTCVGCVVTAANYAQDVVDKTPKKL